LKEEDPRLPSCVVLTAKSKPISFQTAGFLSHFGIECFYIPELASVYIDSFYPTILSHFLSGLPRAAVWVVHLMSQ